MAKLQRDVTVRLLAEKQPTPEEAAAGDEPERFGGELRFRKGQSPFELRKALEEAASMLVDMMEEQDLFTHIELI